MSGCDAEAGRGVERAPARVTTPANYRQLMYLVIVQSVASAIKGTRLGWQRLDRVGVGSLAGSGQDA